MPRYLTRGIESFGGQFFVHKTSELGHRKQCSSLASPVDLFAAAGEWSKPGAPPPDTGRSLLELNMQDDFVEDGNVGAY